jgi:hypothetical protein
MKTTSQVCTVYIAALTFISCRANFGSRQMRLILGAVSCSKVRDDYRGVGVTSIMLKKLLNFMPSYIRAVVLCTAHPPEEEESSQEIFCYGGRSRDTVT